MRPIANSLKHEDRPLRILCLSPFFAPLANAEAFCGSKIALHLLDAGIDLTVFDVDYTGHRKFSRDTSPMWQPLESVTVSTPSDGATTKLFSIPFGVRFLSPDWPRWMAAVLKKARRIHRERPFDVIYSRSLPNIAHIAAYWVARAIRCPWIANFNDPWDLEGTRLHPQDCDKRRKSLEVLVSEFWLRRVMMSADVLTFPNSRLRDYHLRLARPKGECFVVPHVGHCSKPVKASEYFDLTHAGNLGAGESTRRDSTKCLLRGVRAFLDRRPEAQSIFRLLLVGKEDLPTVELAEKLGLKRYVSCTGQLSYSKSLERMAAAPVCLLVEGKIAEGIYLPSKFADYVQSGKPVIALSPSTGTIADVAHLRGVTRVSVDDSVAIESAIDRHYDAFTRGSLEDFEPAQELRLRYDGATIARQLRDLFVGVLAESRSRDNSHVFK